ncbi:MAG: hypothetical protein WCG73_03415, partial [Candidatus Moraniibacteriota bacterium]
PYFRLFPPLYLPSDEGRSPVCWRERLKLCYNLLMTGFIDEEKQGGVTRDLLRFLHNEIF